MPIDPLFLDGILNTFRNMVEDCRKQNISGEDFDKMCSYLSRMEELGQQHSDMNAFNGQVMQENLYGLFSDHYGRALSAQAMQKQTEGGESSFDDAHLLKQCVGALKSAIDRLNESYQQALELASGKHAKENLEKSWEYFAHTDEGKKMNSGTLNTMKRESEKDQQKTLKRTPNAFDNTVEIEVLQNPEPLIKPIQALIDLGEQPGMTLPRFLREQIERGLDKAAEGSAVIRNTYAGELEIAIAMMVSPHYISQHEKQLVVYDNLAAKAKFNVPMAKELQWAIDDVRREFEPDIIKWDKIREMWEGLLDNLHFWSLSYCSFAPRIQPWSLADDPVEATIFTQNTGNGIFPERLKLWKRYWGSDFIDIFKHETFKWEVMYHHFYYSQVFTEFMIEKIFPQCKPFNHLSKELIKERESFYPYGGNPESETNPLLHLRAERFRDYYDGKYGAGRYESKYGPVQHNDSVAQPWNWETFKYK
jgi:hypothetical protein